MAMKILRTWENDLKIGLPQNGFNEKNKGREKEHGTRPQIAYNIILLLSTNNEYGI